MPAPAQGVGVQGKGVVTSGSDVYMPEVWVQTQVFSHSVTINVDLVLSLAAQSHQAYQVMGIDEIVR